MMLLIRLLRFGSLGKPFHWVPVAGYRCPHDSKYLKVFTCYHPLPGQNNSNRMGLSLGLVKRNALCMRFMWIHTGQQLKGMDHAVVEPQKNSGDVPSSGDLMNLKPKRKKLKGRRAVVKWLKFFRWKKKKDYERMTAEEKILYKMRKARKKETRLAEALKKIEPSGSSETTHDPEILTPEEHFYFLKMGHKCKNYVPIGRRGIFQGVILNMHLHWKKHQTLKVVVKTFTPEEVREIAAELARLSGGIVLDIHEENTIIMYRGKNYVQPPTEIMSPKITLSRKKALDKSRYRDALRAVRKHIPRLEQDLEHLHMRANDERECKTTMATEEVTPESCTNREIFSSQLENLLHFGEKESINAEHLDDRTPTESEILSDPEALSDIFDSDSDAELKEREWEHLYLDKIERFSSKDDGKPVDFEEHLRHISAASGSCDSPGENTELSELDEIDKIFLQASSLLKKRR
uniref:Putative CRM domain-containing protein At3g25440, chloroplastic n=1 Tax=Anthurium amnicola TaxID=1678845 RepID=A0A1D1XXI0_9ARAE